MQERKDLMSGVSRSQQKRLGKGWRMIVEQQKKSQEQKSR
jgi:hypothetical protein